MEQSPSTRIYVKNLPPTIKEADFRKHFSAGGHEFTDINLIPRRRIGFVGYKTPADAEKAVKYFNKTFIRLSKISVELARPISQPSSLPTPHKRALSQLPTPEPDTKTKKSIGDNAPPKKRKRGDAEQVDPKLREYLDVMGQGQTSSSKLEGIMAQPAGDTDLPTVAVEEDSDGEYEKIPAPEAKRQKVDVPIPTPVKLPAAQVSAVEAPQQVAEAGETNDEAVPVADATDNEWLRSHTNRLLDLVGPDDLDLTPVVRPVPVTQPSRPSASKDIDMDRASPREATLEPATEQVEDDSSVAQITRTLRLFIRNLSFKVTEAELTEYFAQFGEVEKVRVPVSSSGKGKGFAFATFADSASAVSAYENADAKPFQGRILHVLPGQPDKQNKKDEFAISQLPLQKQLLLRKKAVNGSLNWNTLHMNQDAVLGSTADLFGVSKAELLDPTSTDAAVRQAIAETNIINETKAYFAAHGVNLEAFKSEKKGDMAILVKNIPFGTSLEEVRTLFETVAGGSVLRVLMPPSKTIAMVQFSQPVACRTAFTKLQYKRLGSSVLYLQKAPENLFSDQPPIAQTQGGDVPAGIQKISATDLLEPEGDQDDTNTTSLYVKNLNFDTATAKLTDAFACLDGFIRAQVKTKLDSKKPGQVLSMGFGFVHFRSAAQAQAAVKVMDGHVLDGHTLGVKASHKGADAVDEKRRGEKAKKGAGQRTKIVVKNLAFEASKPDLQRLLGTYGKLRVVRIPKKFDHTSRGFAFAEFESPRDAENAIKSLKDTHLLGRKLVLEYTEAEAVDAEEEIAKMQKKIGGQVNRVAIQKLSSGKAARQKFEVGEEDADA